jgi:hypothetical protein
MLNILSSNFLYNPERQEGVLVDFGLAEVCFHDAHIVLYTLKSKRYY